jgi:hypothetical protein
MLACVESWNLLSAEVLRPNSRHGRQKTDRTLPRRSTCESARDVDGVRAALQVRLPKGPLALQEERLTHMHQR